MNELFGLSMSDLMIAIIILLLIVGITVAFLWRRNSLLFKIGLRNIPRRRAQTTLIVVGLMLSTLIISSAFTTGDTISASLRNTAYELADRVDHLVVFNDEANVNVTRQSAIVPQQVADDLKTEFANDPEIEGFTRVVFDTVPILNTRTGLSSPRAFLLGLDLNEINALGGLPSIEGTPLIISSLDPHKSIINSSMAKEINAIPGDRIQVRALGRTETFTISEVVGDSLVTGKLDPANPEGIVIQLEEAQRIFNLEDKLNGIGVTVRGGIKGSVNQSTAIDEKLNNYFDEKSRHEILTSVPYEKRVYAQPYTKPETGAISKNDSDSLIKSDPFKADAINDAETFGSIFTTLFLVMGLFSIAAGILLIFLIFVMLAEERKPEMGISRAIGMGRFQLVETYLAEGVAYNLGAALIGTLAGILVAFGMVNILESSFGQFGFSFTEHVEPRSIVVAAGIGILLTFITILVSSFRISRLNIVAAIRNLPDSNIRTRHPISVAGIIATLVGFATLPTTIVTLPVGLALQATPRIGTIIRKREKIGWVLLPAWSLMRWRQEWWFTITLIGLLFLYQGLENGSAFLYLIGLSGIPIGGLLLIRRIHKAGRIAHSFISIFVLFIWIAPQSWHHAIWQTEFDGSIEMFFLSGVMMVTAATILAVINLDTLVWGIRIIAQIFGRFRPIIQISAAYPLTTRHRTGMTISMIAIIMFALVMFTTINGNFARAFTGNAAAGGFDIQTDGTINDGTTDLRTALREAGKPIEDLKAVGRIRIGDLTGTRVSTTGVQPWDRERNQPLSREEKTPNNSDTNIKNQVGRAWVSGVDKEFLRTQKIPLQARAAPFKSDQEVWERLQTSGNHYAVVSANAIANNGGFFGTRDDSFFLPESIEDISKSMPSVNILIEANDERAVRVEIIGIVDRIAAIIEPSLPILPTILIPDSIYDDLFKEYDATRFLSIVNPETNKLLTAQDIETTLQMQTVSIHDELKKQQETSNAILILFEGFTGLGLLAGLAALGVIAIRAVVERRHHIGVLRAVGFQRELICATLLIEILFIATIGILIGISLAIILAWRLFADGVFGSTGGLEFHIPIIRISIFAIIALLATLAMTYIPARQAGRATVADALRHE